MQNHCNNCNSGFVTLDGGWGGVSWNCGNCGCSNCGCDACANCGWSRCGCGNGCGSVVAASTRRSSDEYQAETAACQRGSCEKSGQSRVHDCACGNDTYGSRSLYVECCEDNTSIRDLSGECNASAKSRRNRSDNSECSKCSGAAYTQNRSDNGECGKCSGTAYAQNRDNGECGKCSGAAYTQNRCDGDCDRSRKNRGVGMVWAAEQELDQIFESESALRSGTLFPELHKPMNGYCPGECNCQTDEQAAAFAAWELRLYLNTHPNDKRALALFRKLRGETDDPNYATSFLEDMDCGSGWSWTDDPWPWECRPCGK